MRQPELSQRTIALPKTTIICVALAPDGGTLAIGQSDKQIRLWNLATGKFKRTLLTNEADVRAVASAVGQMGMTTIGPETLADRQRIAREDEGPIRDLCFAPDGKTLASVQGDDAPLIKIWDVDTAQVRQRLIRLQSDIVVKLAFVPDGRTLISGGGGRQPEYAPFSVLRVWDTQTGQLRWMRGNVGHSLFPVAIAPDGRTLVAAFAGNSGAQMWDARSGRLLHTLNGMSVGSIAFAPQHAVFATGGLIGSGGFSGGGVILWDTATGRQLKTFAARESGVSDVAFAPDGQNVAGAAEVIRIWNLKTGHVQGTLHFEAVSLAYAPRGTWLAATGNRENVNHLVVWNARTLQKAWQVLEDQSPLARVAFSPDEKLMANVDADSNVHVRNAATGKELRIFHHANADAAVISVAFSKDGRTLLGVTSQGSIRWDVATGLATRGASLEPAFYALAPSSNGQRVVSAGGNTLRFWNTASGQLLATSELLNYRRVAAGTSTSWIAYTPEGYYYGSPDVGRFVRWRQGDQLAPAAAFQAAFLHPELVAKALSTP